MGLSVSISTGFSNRQFQQNNSKNNVREKENENTTDIKNTTVPQTNIIESQDYRIERTNNYMNPTLISINNNLKETLNYLNVHANDKRKQYIFGELWDQIKNTEDNLNENMIIDIEIDFSENNIFAA